MHRLCTCLLFAALTSLMACKASRPLERPVERYETPAALMPSIVNIPISINIAELERTLNRQLPSVLYEDNDLYDGDRLMLRALKQGEIRLRIDSQKVKYQVPLVLWIRYDAGITNVEANGEVVLDMTTGFSINPDWTLTTRTDLVDHRWVREPNLRMGMMSLPVGSVMNVVLRNGRHYLTGMIDEQVRESLQLETLIASVWSQMFEPMLLAEEYNTWLTVNPKRLAMTPLRTEGDSVATTIVVESLPEIKVGARPARLTVAPPLPPLQFVGQSKDDFLINLTTEVSYEEAERLARQQLNGETFESGKHAVTVEDIEIYGSGNNLVINTRLSGSYNGSIYLAGEPVYNARKNTIEVEDLDFTLETKNFLHRSGSWLLKGAIRRKIEENMKFLLDYNLEDMKRQIQAQLDHFQVVEGVVLDGQLRELNIRHVYLTPHAIMVNAGLKGGVNIRVSALR